MPKQIQKDVLDYCVDYSYLGSSFIKTNKSYWVIEFLIYESWVSVTSFYGQDQSGLLKCYKTKKEAEKDLQNALDDFCGLKIVAYNIKKINTVSVIPDEE